MRHAMLALFVVAGTRVPAAAQASTAQTPAVPAPAAALASAPRPTGTGIHVQRITWSKNGDGTIRQLWEASSDGGRTWTVAFDGRYSPR